MLTRPVPVWQVIKSSRYRHYRKAASSTRSAGAPRSQSNATPKTPSESTNTSSDDVSDIIPEIPDYHHKVRALPFAFPPENAIRQAAISVSLLGYSHDRERPNVKPSEIISSTLAKFLPITGAKPIQPSRIQALYFPTWIVDAEIQADASFDRSKTAEEKHDEEGRREGSPNETAIVHMENMYLPGYTMDVGRVLVRDPPRDCDLGEPFTLDLIHQWDQDVMCLPFNTFPLDLIEHATELSYTDAIINEDILFSPASVKANLAAVYPILLPVYLLHYPSREPWSPITVIMAAYHNSGIYHLHILRSDSKDAPRLPFEEYFGDDDYIEGHGPVDNSDFFAHVISRAELQSSQSLSAWLSDKLHERGAPLAMGLRPGRELNMDDVRVREWTTQEVEGVRKWMETGRLMARPMAFIKRWTNQIQEQASSLSGREGKQAAEALQAYFKFEQDKVKQFEIERAAQLPEWWKQWEHEEQQRNIRRRERLKRSGK